MPIPSNPYTDADFITGLYQQPDNAVLLAEYILQTGGIQLGITPAGGVGGNSTLVITEIIGQGGGGPCFLWQMPVLMADGKELNIGEVMPLPLTNTVMAFDEHGALHSAKVKTHLIHAGEEFTRVFFEDGRQTDLSLVHRYWQYGKIFKKIADLKKVQTLINEQWTQTKIADMQTIRPDKPFLFHNLTVEKFGTYIVNGNAVSNSKPVEDPPQ